jgi:serine/threonine-protein kinase
VLWEATVGKRLFRAESQGRTVMRVVSAPIPKPSSLRADYPERLESIVMRALERDPNRRWPTASDMADALETYLYSGGEPAGAGRVATWMRESFPDKLGTRNAMLRSTPGVASVPEVELESQSTIGSHRRASIADASAVLADEESSDIGDDRAEEELPEQMGDFAEEPGETDHTVADAAPPAAEKRQLPVPPPAVPWPSSKPSPSPPPPPPSTPPPEGEPATEQMAAPPGPEPALNAADTVQMAPISSGSIALPKLRDSERPPMRTIPRAWVAAGAGVGLLLVILIAFATGGNDATTPKRAGPKLAAPPVTAVAGQTDREAEIAEPREAEIAEPRETEIAEPREAEIAEPREAEQEPEAPQPVQRTQREPAATDTERRPTERNTRRGQREVRPAAEPGRLNLLAVPRAEVFRGSRRLGTTPLVDYELSAGTHRLLVRELGGNRQRMVRVEIRPGQRTALSVRLDE